MQTAYRGALWLALYRYFQRYPGFVASFDVKLSDYVILDDRDFLLASIQANNQFFAHEFLLKPVWPG